jgi:hypothetical protein
MEEIPMPRLTSALVITLTLASLVVPLDTIAQPSPTLAWIVVLGLSAAPLPGLEDDCQWGVGA